MLVFCVCVCERTVGFFLCSSSSSEGTQDTEGSQSTMDDVDMEIANRKDEIKLKCKMCLKTLNKHSKNEVLIQCGTCNGHGNTIYIIFH